MIPLRLLELTSATGAAATGTAFGLFGFASSDAALMYARPARRFGYRGLALVACVLLLASVATAATSSAVPLLIATMGAMGLASGSLQPLVRMMGGLEAPKSLVATLCDLNRSAVAVGGAVGPFVIGAIAASHGLQWGIAFAVLPLVLVTFTLAFVREAIQ